MCSPADYGCSRLTAAGCAQYAPTSLGVIVAAVLRGLESVTLVAAIRCEALLHCRI